ncbi:hypothetical protein [Acidovorax sp. Root402]|nr:hypothetical protein [Acidovorax sp. Root402]
MSAPIQLIRLRTRRTRHQGLRIAARIGMFALCAAVFLTVFAWVYQHLPR